MSYRHIKVVVLLVFSIILLISCYGQERLPERFFSALNMVETGGRKGAILGDNGKALGPLQIHKAYWIDARMPYGEYKDCAHYEYAKKVVAAYMERYGRRFMISKDYASLARIHNGGPSGPRNPNTEIYAKKVVAAMR